MKTFKTLILVLILTFALTGCVSKPQADVVPPTFSGTHDITYFIGDDAPNYLLDVTATDSVDGDVTANITVDDSLVDLTTPGIYTLTYHVSDESNNSISTSVSVLVIETNTSDDTTPPLIIGASAMTYTIGDTLPNLLSGLYAYDSNDGDLTNQIVADDSLVDYNVAGVYNITYTVSDEAGNAFSITVEITVVDPNQNAFVDQLNIYYLNDFHGAILEDGSDMGLAKIGNLILDEENNHPDNTIFIGGGDFLQGTLISNYFDGSSTMDVFNHLGLDAFTIGNHEFDWGIDVVTNFRDPSSGSLQVDFPLLGANIFYEGTHTRPDFIDPYTVIERGNLKIGVIGVMGSGLESSIANSRITGYYFDDPVYWTAYYAEQLRTVEHVDVVLAEIHDNGVSSGYNQQMSALTGDQRIDAVFNGHSHSTYAQYITRTGVRLPYLQSGSSGTNLGKVTLTLNENKQVTEAYVENMTSSSDARLRTANAAIESLIQTYVAQIEPLLNEVIITSGEYMSTSALTNYMAELIRLASDSDVGFHNSGGTRDYISSGEDITVAKLYSIFPFDNRIKTTYLTGAQIKAFMNSTYGSYNSTRVPNMVFEDDVYYKAATNDYVFDSPTNPFVTGINTEDTGILIRDVLEQVLRNQALTYDYFYLSNPIVLKAASMHDVYIVLPKKEDLFVQI